MKHLLLISILLSFTTALSAQDHELLSLRLETRLDYMHELRNGGTFNNGSGFKGRYLNIIMSGDLGAGFSYSYRQRLNKTHMDASFFDATDWIHLTYTYGNWSASAGKQVVGIGGFEYDSAPINVYHYSEYSSNIACYQIGVSGAYSTGDGRDRFILQFCESPFRKNAANTGNAPMFAYNAMWCGSHEFFTSMWSANMIEYLPGKFINYIALGNRFSFGDFNLDIDIMNRAVSLRNILCKDMTFVGRLVWSPVDCLNVIVKCSHDFNNSGETGDWCVTPGTSITRVTGGIEYFPIKKWQNIRLHLNYCYTDGANGSPAGVLQPKQSIIDAGVTWKMNLLKLKR